MFHVWDGRGSVGRAEPFKLALPVRAPAEQQRWTNDRSARLLKPNGRGGRARTRVVCPICLSNTRIMAYDTGTGTETDKANTGTDTNEAKDMVLHMDANTANPPGQSV